MTDREVDDIAAQFGLSRKQAENLYNQYVDLQIERHNAVKAREAQEWQQFVSQFTPEQRLRVGEMARKWAADENFLEAFAEEKPAPWGLYVVVAVLILSVCVLAAWLMWPVN